MKSLLFVILWFGSLSLYGQLTRVDNVKTQSWYGDLLNRLSNENAIDAGDATFKKMVSSSTHFINKPTNEIVAETGKLNANHILDVFVDTRNMQTCYVFTREGQFTHLFIYEISQSLKRIENRNTIITMPEREHIGFYAATANTIEFATNADRDTGWQKRFEYRQADGTLTFTKNCRMKNGKEVCDPITILE